MVYSPTRQYSPSTVTCSGPPGSRTRSSRLCTMALSFPYRPATTTGLEPAIPLGNLLSKRACLPFHHIVTCMRDQGRTFHLKLWNGGGRGSESEQFELTEKSDSKQSSKTQPSLSELSDRTANTIRPLALVSDTTITARHAPSLHFKLNHR